LLPNKRLFRGMIVDIDRIVERLQAEVDAGRVLG
jgi:hypothetical protein